MPCRDSVILCSELPSDQWRTFIKQNYIAPCQQPQKHFPSDWKQNIAKNIDHHQQFALFIGITNKLIFFSLFIAWLRQAEYWLGQAFRLVSILGGGGVLEKQIIYTYSTVVGSDP